MHQISWCIARRIIDVVQPLLLKICLLSAALLRKNKCSTYSKYVSALFLFAPCIQYHYFQKANEKAIAKATTSILRNLIYLSDTVAFFIEKNARNFVENFVHGGLGCMFFIDLAKLKVLSGLR